MVNKQDVQNAFDKGYERGMAIALMEFNWRWKRFLKQQYTQQQFSTEYRKELKKLVHFSNSNKGDEKNG